MNEGPIWRAHWIDWNPDPRTELGVYAFRRRLPLEDVPAKLFVRVSADQRYRLFVNGRMVAFGPQRGDLRHWFYETLDLAPHLTAGENWVTALVWNFGRWAPMAQISARTGFVVHSLDDAGLFDTPGDWEVARLDGWGFEMSLVDAPGAYIDVGPGEVFDARRVMGDWWLDGRLDWQAPNVVCRAEERGASSGSVPWMLTPRTIPFMRYEKRDAAPIDRTSAGANPIDLRPGLETFLDYGELLCAFPRITLEGEAGTTVHIGYAEALWMPDGQKGHRSVIEGKRFTGYQDRVVLGDGPATFEPLWWRTYRYLRLTADAPVRVAQIDAFETGYPLQPASSFHADDPVVEPIWEAGVRTAQRCAGETYFDCPYYEQLQYVGDTRIQALIGYYLDPDRALQRNAVETLSWSIREEGLTHSRYPSRQSQVIPPFSLWWVLMLYDQMLYDTMEVSPLHEDQAREVILAWKRLTRGPADRAFWLFADWVPEWPGGIPPGGPVATVHLLTELLARIALADLLVGQPFAASAIHAEELERDLGGSLGAPLHRHKRSGEDRPSEHAEALFRCAQLMCGIDPDPWPAEALARDGADACTFYFAYYKHLAMQPEDYVALLEPWARQIEGGLTTFAETPEPTRSDCHAWSAHPLLGFFQFVAGVTSVAAGWRRAMIRPRPGRLKRFDARIAHPAGLLRVEYESERLRIDSPVRFELRWQGKRHSFEPGSHAIG